MKILAIESSCDEFSVAINVDGEIKTNIISSQIKDHIQFGGVVPELASRLHVKNFPYVLDTALKESGLKISDITHVAYTARPGLIGSLIVGKIVAETIASFLNVPILDLHHIHGHIYAANIEKKFVYPTLSLVVSGGHTQLVLIKGPIDFEILGTTLDDAIGECYDKVARVLGLEYPGGPKIDKLAFEGDASKYEFPNIMNDKSLDFSFSGLKTASINLISKVKNRSEEIDVPSFCASFQKKAISSVIRKLNLALDQHPEVKMISIAGGVSANKELRNQITALGKEKNIEINIPNMEYCTDNAAMIAELAYVTLNK
jgi:N6-L-threonylcarbamoyladenine synthase